MKSASQSKFDRWEGRWGGHRVDAGIVTKALGAWIISVIAPYEPILIGAFFLIFADTLTGVWSAVKRGETIISAELRHSVTKTLIYLMALLSGIAAESMIPGGISFAKAIGSLIAVTELLSILENCNAILGNRLFDLLLKRLGSRNQKS